ncbi:MAG: TetR/AcrR family transcriptional regulator [Myxococcota bacterium]|nr:TetR/AcrR family transcriptional regulator [Myxococcota bacterium]
MWGRPLVNTPAESPSSREKILDVAELRFAQRGYAGVGLREVAEAAGLGKSSLFHHFKSKAALNLAVLDRVLARMRRRMEPSLQGGGDARVRLDRVVEELVDGLAEHPTSARLLLRALFEDDDLPQEGLPEAESFERTLAAFVASLEALLADGVAQGAFRELDAAHTLQTLIGATIYHFASGEFGESLLGGPLFSAEAVARRKREVLAFIHHGILRAPA